MRIRFRKPRAEAPADSPAPGPQAAPGGSAATPQPQSPRPATTAGQATDAEPEGANGAATQAAGASSPAEGGQARDPHEETAGLRAWLAETDRKLGFRTYIGAALVVLAVAAAAVALVLTLSLKRDSPTQDEVDSLRDQLSVVQLSAAQAAQRGAESVNQRLTALEGRIDKLEADQTTSKRELQVVQDDIKELRSQVSGGTGAGAGSSSDTGTGFGAPDTSTGAGGTGP
jgi:uncharacterized protein HemX